jgi:hypothetical protein
MRKTFGIERRSFLRHFDSEGALMSVWHCTAIEFHSILPQDQSAFQRIAQNKRLALILRELGLGLFRLVLWFLPEIRCEGPEECETLSNEQIFVIQQGWRGQATAADILYG